MKNLPIGIQNFKKLITENYLYVDKTRYIHELAKLSTPYFISRPRRFGKSLTVSTFYSLFTGEGELFKDTWIYTNWDFKKHPVINISMTEVDTTDERSLKTSLVYRLKRTYRENDLVPETENLKLLFSDLIYRLSEKGSVVVLIDEYDKPILDHLSDPEMASRIRNTLREFYAVIKDADQYLRFVFITGITKFTKTGVFSAINNLRDLTVSSGYSCLMGYTRQELETAFTEHLDTTAREWHTDRCKVIEELEAYYNGFSFDGQHFVYNPFSILSFFAEKRLDNYWIETGSPSFLVEYAKTHTLTPDRITGTWINSGMLTAYEIEQAPPVSFLIQAGYLTFKLWDKDLGYLVDYPNREVRDSFSPLVLAGSFGIDEWERNDVKNAIITGLREQNFTMIFRQMQRILSSIPYHLYDKKESFYHSVVLTLLWASGVEARAEEPTNLGRSDIVIFYRDDVYVLELKRKPPEEALKQREQKRYAEKYRNKNVFLIGIEIDDEQRNLSRFKLSSQRFTVSD